MTVHITNGRAAGNDQPPKGYPVSLGNDMPVTAYLVEFRAFPDEPSELRLYSPRDLVSFLTSNIEHAHYAGDEVAIVGIWRYDGNGGLVKLVLNSRASGTDDNDYIHTDYVLREKHETAKVELAFTITLDGRV